MTKHLSSILFLTTAIATMHVKAQVDTAYIQDQVRQTIEGSAQNKSRFSDTEIADIIKKSNENSKRYSNDAQTTNNNTQNHLQSNQAKRDQNWAKQTMQNIQNSPEHKQNLKDAYVICKTSERNSSVDLHCGQ
ncbi:hypothetical protein KTJ32_04585 [Acinetobacter gyllenbergii]|uniref:hypothetical protein n=1 Tax=Acinetobacter gyllenbergii TaxID=134534 RepID=UPI0021D23A11|nr:hypothetical protein [Acinetobacter gyllenbergii]MCU4580277.1 hypothetical protein [Acinetobacter gyllenbergii]